MDRNNKTIRQIPADERPYEKCERSGAAALSDAELLAVILRSGTRDDNVLDVARALLTMNPNTQGLEGIVRSSTEDFQKVSGIGPVKAIQISAAVELARRISRLAYRPGEIIDCPQKAADYYMTGMAGLDHEELHIMMLDTRGGLIGEEMLTSGTVNRTLIDPRDIFIRALKDNAAGIIMVHNHPSGDPVPSRDDIDATIRVRDAGRLIGIALIDHIIIGGGTYTSLCSEGNL